MKNVMDQRMRRIEDLLRDEATPCMVAMKTEQGIEWNGVMYPDGESLHEAMETICGRNTEYRPLVIISRRGNREKDLQ